MQYLTAYGALVKLGQVKKGEFILITAASSATDPAAIQIAKAEGAIPVRTTPTGAKREELLALGPDQVIVTDEEELLNRVGRLQAERASVLFLIQSRVRCSTYWPRCSVNLIASLRP